MKKIILVATILISACSQNAAEITDGLASYKKNMNYHTNSSNNTVYADADGNIGFFHGNFIPKRSLKFDWTKPVDGSIPETEWQGIHTVDESINQFNPYIGWLQNTNN